VSETSSHYIEFIDVYKTFDKPVLADVSFHVDAGETLAIIGRSGVGKSVSLGHIMGFLKPDQGRVFVAYSDITDMGEADLRAIRKKVTMVFQSGALFDSLTVGENILFSLETRDDYNEQNKEDVVRGLDLSGKTIGSWGYGNEWELFAGLTEADATDYTIVQRYTRDRISYWLCSPAALELRRSQDGRNAVCLRRAEG